MDLLGIIERTWWLGLPTAVFLGAVLGAIHLAWLVLAAAVGTRAGTTTWRGRQQC
ncbi:MAG: hypothetical protein KY469_19875 [Actinobacteria bacterium]|nr:hypothetical protein [Actinomycetota bacterium]